MIQYDHLIGYFSYAIHISFIDLFSYSVYYLCLVFSP